MVNLQTQKPRYYLEIDEEGFVVFDGLRVDDEAFVKPLLEKIHRQDPQNPRSPLVTTCEGELIFLGGFSSPLVAQRMEWNSSEQKVHWQCLYGLRFESPLQDLSMDEWNRLHAYVGPFQIPITATRQAQTRFLLSLDSTQLDAIKSRHFRHGALEAPRASSSWEEVYQSGQDGWDLGGPNPVLVKELSPFKTLLPRGRVLVPGCGRGHDASFLLENHYEVEMWDVAPSAKSEFHRLYPQWSAAPFQLGDFFKLSQLEKYQASFDAIFEHTCFCAIDPSERGDFIKGVTRLLKPGGFYFGIFYLKTSPGGPPFGLSEWELRERLSEKFHFRAWKRSMDSLPRRLGEELWVVAQRVTKP